MSASYRDAVRATLLYLLISVVWMQLSGFLLSSLFDDSAERLHCELINVFVRGGFDARFVFLGRGPLFSGPGGEWGGFFWRGFCLIRPRAYTCN